MCESRQAWAAILLLCLLPSAHTTQAADADSALTEEEILFGDIPSVFGASKYEQKITEAPSRISIVTAEEIRRFGYRTLSEVLRSLPGFFTSNDRNYSYTGVRGFGVPGDYDTRLLQLVDGHRINDNLYGSLFSDHTFPVDLSIIDRIEVIRGPSSSLYGSGAFQGVVNVITKKGRDIGGWQLSGTADSQNTNQGQISYGERFGSGFEVLLSATVSDGDGDDRLYYPEYDDPLTNNGIAEDVDGEDYHKFFARLSYGDFALEGAYGQRNKTIPTGSYGTVFNSTQNETMDSRGYVDLKYQTLLNDGSELLARVHYDTYDYKGDYLYDYGDLTEPYLSLNKDSASGRWWGSEAQWSKKFSTHHFVLGGEFRDSTREEQKNYDQDGVYLDSDTDSSLWAVFIQDEITLRENLVVNLGVRHDDYSKFGGTTNPRGALIWTPLETSTLKLLYGKAFRAPNAYELYYNDSNITTKPSGDLEPETIESIELVIEQQISSQLRGVVSVYRNEIDDLIALSTDPADGLLVYINQGDADANGLELELERRWQSGALATMSYTYQKAEDAQSNERLVNSPEDMLKLNLMLPLFENRAGVALETQYEGDRKTLAGNRTDDRWLVNLGLFSEEWIPNLAMSLSIYNLLDSEYGEPGSEEHLQDEIEQNERTYRVRLDYSF